MSSNTSSHLKNDESFLLEDLLDERSFHETALERAALITPFVNSVTLGPNSSFGVENSVERRSSITISLNNSSENEKPRRKVCVTNTPVTTSDLKAMQQKVHQQSEDRKMKEQIRKKLEARCVEEKKIYKKFQIQIDAKKIEAEKKHKAKVEALEKQIENALRIDEQEEQVYQKQLLELTKNTRKILEEQEKDLRDNLKRLEDHFLKLENSFNKIVQSCNPEMSQIVDLYKKQFDDIKVQKNSHRSSLDGLKSVCVKVEEMCHGLLKVSKEFEAEFKARQALKEAEVKQAAEQAKALALAQAQALKQVAHVQPFQQEASPAVPPQAPAPVAEIPPQIQQATRSENRYFNELMQFLTEKQNATRQLTTTPGLETIRFALKLAVNNPINILNEQNKTTLVEGFQKLHKLLSGQRVETSKGAVAITDHNEASDWTKLRIAEKLIDACDKKPETTFYVAALTVALWQKFPDFGKIFNATLFKECPFLVPYKPPIVNGESERDFLVSWGYRVDSTDRPEAYTNYQSRTSKFAALLGAIWITNSRRDEQSPHPFGIDNGWKYLVNVFNSPTNSDPMYLHILDKLLEVAGSTLHLTYGRQFTKLMLVLRDQYLPSIESRVDESMRGAFDRFRNVTIAKFFSENRFAQPKGKLTANFW